MGRDRRDCRHVKSVPPDPGPVTLQVYQPMAQDPRPYNEIAVRTSGVAPSTLVQSIRDVMTQLDPDLPVRQLQAADPTIERANYQDAILRDILSSFALVGLGLASLGIYGVIARTMAQRSGGASRFVLRSEHPGHHSDRPCCREDGTHRISPRIIGRGLCVYILAAANPAMHLKSPLVLIATTLLLIPWD